MDAPVSRTNTSSSVGLCRPTESIAPGNASTTSAIKRWPFEISTRTCPSTRGGRSAEALPDARGERLRIGWIPAPPHRRRCASAVRAELPWATILPLMQQHQAVAAVGLVQDVRGEQDGDAFLLAQAFNMAGEFAARRRIESGGGFVHQQDLRAMQQRFGDLHAAAQAAGKRVHQIVAAIFQAEPLHGVLHAARGAWRR